MSAKFEITTITPTDAQNMLANMVDNRHIKQPIVDRFARDMMAGDWLLVGDPIRFDTDGRLIDGQHRLRAVIKAGISIPFATVRNIPKSAMAIIDTGTSRKLADILKIENIKYAKTVSNALRLLYLHRFNDGHDFGKTRGISISLPQIMGVVSEEEIGTLQNEMVTLASMMCGKVCREGIALFVYHEGMRKYPRKTAEFFELFLGGENLKKTMPAYHLRNFCVNERSRRSSNARKEYYLGVFTKAFMMHITNKEIRSILKLSDGEEIQRIS